MPRGRKPTAAKTAVTTTQEEVSKMKDPTELDTEVEEADVEVTEEDLAEEIAFSASAQGSASSEEDASKAQVDPEDPYGFNDEDEAEGENSTELSPEVVGNLVKITYKGLRGEGRSSQTVTLIVPDDGTAADDTTAIIRSGTDYRLQLGVPAYVTPEHADWLAGHTVLDIEKA